MERRVITMYAVKDIVAEEFGPPFAAKNDGVACRHYADIVKTVHNPAEYELYELYSWDLSTGEIITCTVRKVSVPGGN